MQVIGNVQNLVLGGAKVYVMPDNEYLELGLLRGQTALTITTETVQVEQGCPRKLVANFVRKTGASLTAECMDISLPVMSLATGLPLETESHDVTDVTRTNATVTAGAGEGNPATATLTELPQGLDPATMHSRVFGADTEHPVGHYINWDDYQGQSKVVVTEDPAGSWNDLEALSKVELYHSEEGEQTITVGVNSEVPTLNGVVIVKFNAKSGKSTVVEMPYVQANGGLNLVYDNDAQDVMAINIQLDAVSNPNNLDDPICTIKEVDGEFIPGEN